MKEYHIRIHIAGIDVGYGFRVMANSKDEALEKAKLNFIPIFKCEED